MSKITKYTKPSKEVSEAAVSYPKQGQLYIHWYSGEVVVFMGMHNRLYSVRKVDSAAEFTCTLLLESLALAEVVERRAFHEELTIQEYADWVRHGKPSQIRLHP